MIEQYSAYQWLSFFFIYSVLGWVFESSYVSLKTGKLTNRGFLKGPYLPIYGSGAVMMLFVSEPFKDQLVLTYFAGLVGATGLELATGAAIEAIFKVRYWDYSTKKFNYKGYICLSSSVVWGFFTVGMNQWLHPALLMMKAWIPDAAGDILFAFVGITFTVDVVVSVKEAVDMRELLIRVDNMRYEMELMKRRADVILAVMDYEFRNQMLEYTAPAAGKLSELRSSLESQLTRMKSRLSESVVLSESQRAELEEVISRFNSMKISLPALQEPLMRGFRRMVMANPSMTSLRYRLSWDSLKQRLKEDKREMPDFCLNENPEPEDKASDDSGQAYDNNSVKDIRD